MCKQQCLNEGFVFYNHFCHGVWMETVPVSINCKKKINIWRDYIDSEVSMFQNTHHVCVCAVLRSATRVQCLILRLNV